MDHQSVEFLYESAVIDEEDKDYWFYHHTSCQFGDMLKHKFSTLVCSCLHTDTDTVKTCTLTPPCFVSHVLFAIINTLPFFTNMLILLVLMDHWPVFWCGGSTTTIQCIPLILFVCIVQDGWPNLLVVVLNNILLPLRELCKNNAAFFIQ